jgi:putative transposase
MDEEFSRSGRRSIRLSDYDYALEGAYCVTICRQDRVCWFGTVDATGTMQLSVIGSIVRACWMDIPAHFPDVELDAFVVMPNHVHGIVVIADGNVRVEEKRATHVPPLQRPSGYK